MTPHLLPANQKLIKWIKAGGQPNRTSSFIIWRYRWHAYWADKNWAYQDRLFQDHQFEGDGGERLLFILGLWRSGTTLLHELLASGPGMAAPRTWQCMNPAHFSLIGEPGKGNAVRRPMDSLVVEALSPQEDEFALLARGVPSIYRVWIDPRRWEEALPTLKQATWLSLPKEQWLTCWRRFLGACMPEAARILVVKSPNHIYRLQAIHQAWPKARFVWIVRDPLTSWHSNRRMWQAMVSLYALWQWRKEDLDCLLKEAFNQYLITLRWATATLPQIHFVELQQLAMDTSSVLRKVVEQHDLGEWSDWEPLVSNRIRQSTKHLPESLPPSHELPRELDSLFMEIQGEQRRAVGE